MSRTTELLLEASRITRLHFDAQHPDVARVDYLLGAVAYSREDWEGVRQHYGAAREVYQSLTGHEDDAALAGMYVGIADVKTERFRSAITLLEQAREAFAETSSPQHYRLAVLEYNLGEAHFGLEDWEQALEFFEIAHNKFLEASGPDHHQTRGSRLPLADSHLKLAETRLDEGRIAEAQDHYEKALSFYEGVELSDERRELIEQLRAALF